MVVVFLNQIFRETHCCFRAGICLNVHGRPEERRGNLEHVFSVRVGNIFCIVLRSSLGASFAFSRVVPKKKKKSLEMAFPGFERLTRSVLTSISITQKEVSAKLHIFCSFYILGPFVDPVVHKTVSCTHPTVYRSCMSLPTIFLKHRYPGC